MIKETLLIGALFFAPLTTTLTETTEQPEVQEVIDETKDVVEDVLATFLTPEKVALVMSVITNIGVILGVAVKIGQAVKLNEGLSEKVKSQVMDTINENLKSNVSLKEVEDTCKQVNDALKVLTKITALQQENTPESKIAILNVIEELGHLDQGTLVEAKTTIEEQVKTAKKAVEDSKEAIDKIINDGTEI